MKIIHTSDWHIGHVLYNWDRSDEHQHFLDILTETVRVEQPDALLICGDIFHTAAPSALSQKTYIENMLRIHNAAPGMTIVVTAGNHDSSSRLETDRSLWMHFNLHTIGSVARADEKDIFDKHIIPVGNPVKGYVLAVPHCYPQNFPDLDGDTSREDRPARFFNALLDKAEELNTDRLPIVMTAHATVPGCNPGKQDIIVGGLDSMNISELNDRYDYLALGHIHYPQNIGRKARYSGSPLPISFNEDHMHSITIAETGMHGEEVRLRIVEIPALREMVTLPQEPVGFEQALKQLEDFPSDKDAYIRLNVKVRQYGGADWAAKASAATEGKKCRYCYIQLQKENSGDEENGHMRLSQEEIRKISPMDVARIHWKEIKGSEMAPELEEKLYQVMTVTQGE